MVINRRNAEPDPLHKMLRLHLGPVARWPWLVQVLLPLVSITGLWIALHPLLAHLEITGRVRSNVHLAEQGLLIGVAVFFTPAVFCSRCSSCCTCSPVTCIWGEVPCGISSARLPATCWRRLRWLPLRIARLDFAPLAGVVLILFLLHWLPNLILGQMAEHNVSRLAAVARAAPPALQFAATLGSFTVTVVLAPRSL